MIKKHKFNVNTSLVKKALKVAVKAHKGQFDKAGKPYIDHPIHIAKQMETEDEIIVALLHDVVEDTDITLGDLRAHGFPESVINALTLLTHNDNDDYMEYIENIKSNPLAVKVKLADLRHKSDLSHRYFWSLRGGLNNIYFEARIRAEKYRSAISLFNSTLREPERTFKIIKPLKEALQTALKAKLIYLMAHNTTGKNDFVLIKIYDINGLTDDIIINIINTMLDFNIIINCIIVENPAYDYESKWNGEVEEFSFKSYDDYLNFCDNNAYFKCVNTNIYGCYNSINIRIKIDSYHKTINFFIETEEI